MEEEESWGAPNLWQGLTAAQTAEWLAVVRQILELDGITPHSLGGSPPSPRNGGKAKDKYEQCIICGYPGWSPHGGKWRLAAGVGTDEMPSGDVM